MTPAPIRFGRFVLDIAQRRLLADGAPVTLGSRAFELLQVLVEQRPRVVAKAELFDHPVLILLGPCRIARVLPVAPEKTTARAARGSPRRA